MELLRSSPRALCCQPAPVVPNSLMFIGAVEQDIVIIHWATPPPHPFLVTVPLWCLEETASAMAESSVLLPSSLETKEKQYCAFHWQIQAGSVSAFQGAVLHPFSLAQFET